MTTLTPESASDPFIDDVHPSNARRVVAVVAIVVVVAMIGLVGFQAAASSTSTKYRTAPATTTDVTAMITSVASIEPVSQASVAFAVAGTVQTVDVAVGDTVVAGAMLATIDTQALDVAVHQKQSTLANARLTLSKALDAQTSSATSSTTSSGSSVSGGGATGGGGGGATGGGGTSGPTPAQIAAAQQQVVSSQHAVDTALTSSAQALSASTLPCTAPSTAPEILACQNALQAVSNAQAHVAAAQQNLATAAAALDALLAQQATAMANSASATSTSTVPSSGGASSRAAGAGTSAAPTAADIASDQAAVDAAATAVTAAEQSLALAAIVSPIDGRVVAVNLSVGQSVTANSTTANVVVQGQGGLESTLVVSVDQVPTIKVGQIASVLPDGSADPVVGHVVLISSLPASTTNGVTYRVTIALDQGSDALRNGTIGTASIVTATAKNVLSVPTSAVHVNGSTHSVDVLVGSQVSTETVTVGVVGSDRTEITSGLTGGEQIVLADISIPLPGSATTTNSAVTTTGTRNGTVTPGGNNFTGGGNFPGAGNGTGGGARNAGG
jgi:multidrug efflux pump subunit AcrA (membrane-fusion protein)